MFLLFGRRAKLKRRKGGGRERRRCPECENTCDFFEADEKEAFHVFFIELYSGDDVVWVCSDCDESMAYEETLPPARSAREEARAAKGEQKLRRARAKSEAKERARREHEVDDELARLKRRLRESGSG